MKKDEVKDMARTIAYEILECRNKYLEEKLDSRYQDVKLLMRNYRKLKVYYAHVDTAVLEVSTISNTFRKTGLMMSHVEKMLAAYKALCAESNNPEDARRWQVLYLRYMSDKRRNLDDIADMLCINKRTLYRDTERAMEDMAVLLFGLDVIGSWRKA